MEDIDYYKLYKKYKLKYKNTQYGATFGINPIGEEVAANVTEQGVDEEMEGDEEENSFSSTDPDKQEDELKTKEKKITRKIETLDIMNKVIAKYNNLTNDPKIKLVSQIRDIFKVNKNPAFNPKDTIPININSSQWVNLKKTFTNIGKKEKFNQISKLLKPSTIYELISKICIFSYADSIESYFNHLNPMADHSCLTASDKTDTYSKILLCVMQHHSSSKRGKRRCAKKKNNPICHYSKDLEICLPKNIKAQPNKDKKFILRQENIPELLYNSVQSLIKFAEIDYIIGQFLHMTKNKSNTILNYWENILKISTIKLKNIKNVYKIKLQTYKTHTGGLAGQISKGARTGYKVVDYDTTEDKSQYKREKIIYEEIIEKIQEYIEALVDFVQMLQKINANYLENYINHISEWTPDKPSHTFFPPFLPINPIIFTLPELFTKDTYKSETFRENIPFPTEIKNIWMPLS